MNYSRQFLIGVLALGLQLGNSRAAEPAPETVNRLSALPPATHADAAIAPQLPCLTQVCCDHVYCGSGHGGLAGGVGIYLIQPYFQDNLAYSLIQQTTTPQSQRVERVDISHHVDAAPVVWLGYAGDKGLGARARWWYFRQGTEQSVSLPPFTGGFNITPPPEQNVIQTSGILTTVSSATPLGLQGFGDTLSRMHGPEATSFVITSKLEVQVADLEATHDWQAGGWDFLFSGGVRLARIDQAYNAFDAQSTSARELRTLLSSYVFQGAGPVLAVEARRPLRGSCLALYGSPRGSVLFGSAHQNASFGGLELRNDDPNPQVASQQHDRGLPIGELEVGLEFRRSVGGSSLFGQVALVGQDWIGAGNASRSAVATVANSPPTVGGAVADSDIGFFGLTLRLGLNY